MITAGQQVNQENSTRYQLIKEIQRAAQMNEIPQICGRLGDLATISERYDVAITVACPALDNIVVKTYLS
jgi:structural maintenance of chromosome 4